MALAHRIHKVTFSGESFGGAEEWSTSLNIGFESADAGDVQQSAVDAIAAMWETFFTNPQSKFNNSWSTTQVKVARFNTNGKTDLAQVRYFGYGTPLLGGFVGNPFPAQISLAATLESAISRGPASKGRMYLPGIVASIGGNGKIVSGDVIGIADNFEQFISELNNSTDVPGTVILASPGRGTPFPGDFSDNYLPPTNARVTRVRVGDVMDTQRRRRNSLVEAYTTRDVEPGTDF